MFATTKTNVRKDMC